MDDEPDWLSEDVVEETPATEEEAPVDGEAPAEGDAAPEAEPEPEPEPEPPRPARDPFRLVLYKHWMRPIHAQYNYLYDYRKNYYDDVIDYMDRRQKGITRDVPRAQTWAERALRSYVQNGHANGQGYIRTKADISLLSNIRTEAKFYRYHTKEYISKRYPILFR